MMRIQRLADERELVGVVVLLLLDHLERTEHHRTLEAHVGFRFELDDGVSK